MRALTVWTAWLGACAAALSAAWMDWPHAALRPVPAVVVGGSAAAGWTDPEGPGYVVRGLNKYARTIHVTLTISNHSVVGAPATDPAVAKRYPAWMQKTKGGLAVIAWGYLNGARLHVPPAQVVKSVRREILQALGTDHTVLLVSPPATDAGLTFERAPQRTLWTHVVSMVRGLNNPHVYILDVMDAMTKSMRRHNQPVVVYSDKWDPSMEGHLKAAQILSHELERQVANPLPMIENAAHRPALGGPGNEGRRSSVFNPP